MTASQDPEARSPQPDSAGELLGSRPADGAEYRLPDAAVSGGRLTDVPRAPSAPAAEPTTGPPPSPRPIAFAGSAGQVWVERSTAGRPRAVTIACALGVADVVIAFVMLGTRLITTDDLILQALGQADSFLPNDGDISGVYYGVTTGLIALYVLLAAVWGLLVLFMGRGRNWARAALTIVAFVWAVSTLLSLVGTRSHGQLLTSLEVVQALSLVATLVCMHVTSTRDYFSGH
ncbi:hypothetical protein [Saccharopolyspora gloriosae]|uniref:hypothetical protein n=1 Tax=Saccharopolyspora gloriosae TaxID=455344 RepID=UPI001FB75530|nr:hypothetical protein [Saccharopolyspora gloriosae]